MNRVAVKSELVQWARERAHLGIDDLANRFPRLADLQSGVLAPTFRQLKAFSKATHVPFGFLFLPEPPDIPMPIPDFRTLQNREDEDLVQWVRNGLPADFFLESPGAEVVAAYQDVMLWVQRIPQYLDNAKTSFATEAEDF